MGYEAGIKAVFGGDLSKLKESLTEARAEVAKLNQSGGSREGHRLLSGLIGAEALNKLKEFTGEAIKNAQEIRDKFEEAGKPVENDVRTLAEFGDGLKDVHEGAIKAVGFLIGGFTQLGDLIGSSINRLRGVSEAQENVARSTERAAEDQEKALKKLQDANSPEKLAAAQKRLDDARRTSLLARLSDEGKLAILIGEQTDLQKQLEQHAGETVQHKEIETKIEESLAQADTIRLALKKKDSEELHKQADALNQTADERSKLAARQHEFDLEQLSDADRLIALKRDEKELEKGIAIVGKDGATGVELGNSLLDVQMKIRETNLAITRAQAQEEHHVAEGIKEQKAAMASGGSFRTGRQFGQASDEALEEQLRRNRQKVQGLNTSSATNLSALIERGTLQGEDQNIQKELDSRNKIRGDIKRGGIESARRNFQGDPLAFDRLAEQFSKGLDKDDKMLLELQKLNGNVSGLFRNH